MLSIIYDSVMHLSQKSTGFVERFHLDGYVSLGCSERCKYLDVDDVVQKNREPITGATSQACDAIQDLQASGK